MTTASGSDALFGVVVDQPSDLYSIGHPGMSLAALATPVTKPTAAAGAAGTLTGGFHWRYSTGKLDGSRSYPGPASDAALTVAVGTPGLDDATFSGTFNIGGAAPRFEVEIDLAAGTDTFKWRINDLTNPPGAWTTGVSCSAGPHLLGYGISVTFAAATGHTLGDAWYRESALVLTADKASLTTIAIAAEAWCDRRVIERTGDYGVTWAIVGTLFDNTTVIFTDDEASPDASKVLPTVLSEAGANYGFTFLDLDAFDVDPDFGVLDTNALRGSAGRPRGIPGPIKIDGSPKGDVKAASLAPILSAGCGKPTVTPSATEPTVISAWTATTGRRAPRTLSAFLYDGAANIAPLFLYGLACEELSIAFAGGKIVDNTFKLVGANYGVSPPAEQTSGTGTFKGVFVAMGSRYDARVADVDGDLFIKITAALSGGVVKFKTKVSAAATYDGTEWTLYTDAVSGKQTRGGTQFNDGIELFDENDVALGADIGSNRQPYLLYTSGGDLADLDLNDEFKIVRVALIPGLVSGASPEPFSGVPPRFIDGPRFTDAHVTITKGGAVIDATAGSLKLSFPKKQVNSLCAGARSLQDLVNDGYFAAEVTITRYLKDTEWRDMMRVDDRAVVTVSLTGERIPIGQGALSTHRESFTISIPQFVVKSAKAPKANQSTVVETIAGEAEQPDNSALDLFTMTLKTRQGWAMPA